MGIHPQVHQGAQPYVHPLVPLYNQSICGSVLPQPVETTSNLATIYFLMEYSTVHRGFKLRYTTDLPALCGGTLEPGRGNITSPNVSLITDPTTTSNVYCVWRSEERFYNGTGTTIVTIHRLETPGWVETDAHCRHGFLLIVPCTQNIFQIFLKTNYLKSSIMIYCKFEKNCETFCQSSSQIFCLSVPSGSSESELDLRNWRKLCTPSVNKKVYLPGSGQIVQFVV